MQKNILKFILVNLTFLLLSCNLKNKETEKKEKLPKLEVGFFSDERINGFNSCDTLTLKTQFNECGEWGGHKEEMIIYVKPGKGFFLNYNNFSVNCDSIDVVTHESIQNLETSKTIKLNESNKISVKNYLNRLLESKINESNSGNSGNIFAVTTSRSSLLIKVSSNKSIDIESYNKLQNELGFSITDPKENE